MLYVIECVINLIFMSSEPLSTTGNPMTINDIGVGFLVIMVFIAIIWLIVHSVRFYKSKNRLESVTADEKNNLKDRHTNYLISILYYFECYALIFLCLLYGKSVIMKTTGQKPSNNEIVICVIWWLYTALIIMSVIFIVI